MGRKIYIEIDEDVANSYLQRGKPSESVRAAQILRNTIGEALKERDPRFTGQIFSFDEVLWDNAAGNPILIGLNLTSPSGYAAFFQERDGQLVKVGEAQATRPALAEKRENWRKGFFGSNTSELLAGVDPDDAFEMAARQADRNEIEVHGAEGATLEPAENQEEIPECEIKGLDEFLKAGLTPGESPYDPGVIGLDPEDQEEELSLWQIDDKPKPKRKIEIRYGAPIQIEIDHAEGKLTIEPMEREEPDA